MADQVLVDAVPRIDLTNLIEELKTKNRESLVEAIEVYQERLLEWQTSADVEKFRLEA